MSNFRYTDADIVFTNLNVLKRLTTENGKIVPGRTSRLNRKEQCKLAREIRRARFLALLPYSI